MKKASTAKITKSTLDTLLFGAWRYYIGRHTIAAHSAANEIAELFIKNPDVFSKERKEFMGKDIVKMINDQVNWSSNVCVDNSFVNTPKNALILLCNATINLFKELGKPFDVETFNKYYFVVDVLNGDWCCTLNDNEPDTSLSKANLHELITDLDVWCKLSSYLIGNQEITYTYEGKTTTSPAICFPSLGRYIGDDHETLQVHYNTIENYEKDVWKNQYIASEYINKTSKP